MVESKTKVDLILELLSETAGRDRVDWLLWVEQNAMVRTCLHTSLSGHFEPSVSSFLACHEKASESACVSKTMPLP